MTKTLKQILGEKPILFTSDVPERVTEWLMQKRQKKEQLGNTNYAHFKIAMIDELLEELQK